MFRLNVWTPWLRASIYLLKLWEKKHACLYVVLLKSADLIGNHILDSVANDTASFSRDTQGTFGTQGHVAIASRTGGEGRTAMRASLPGPLRHLPPRRTWGCCLERRLRGRWARAWPGAPSPSSSSTWRRSAPWLRPHKRTMVRLPLVKAGVCRLRTKETP